MEKWYYVTKCISLVPPELAVLETEATLRLYAAISEFLAVDSSVTENTGFSPDCDIAHARLS